MKKMKKAKLFMMLALLVMGVSNVMGATKDFYVNYEREFIEGGYTINTNAAQQYGYSIQQFGNLTSLGTQEVGDRMIRVTYDDSDWFAPSASTIASCITPKAVSGYTTRVVGIDNTIYICYIWSDVYNGVSTSYGQSGYTINLKTNVLNQHKWSSGSFTYSDLYLKTDSRQVKNVIKLPANQCAIELNIYTDTEITIPQKDPTKKYNVVAIQGHGMGKYINPMKDYFGEPQNPDFEYVYLDACSGSNAKGYAYNDYQNGNLNTVNFQKTSNIRSIGDYAFASCYALQTIEIPQSVEYLGEAAFSVCTGLTDGLTFERASGTSFRTNIKVIRNYTFWTCLNMTDLELPDGIIVIEGQQGGAAMQYMTGLTSLRLPNTLVAIGPHFLCDASSLPEVTIPASVKYIDGACFHGCEQLRTVYLMGPASALQGAYEGSDTFGKNETLCKDPVNKCVFITTQENIKGYAEDPNGVWQLIAGNKQNRCQTNSQLRAVKVDEEGNVVRSSDGTPQLESTYLKNYNSDTYVTTKNETKCAMSGGNALTYLTDQKLTFTPGKWVTVIFPKAYTQARLQETFGSDVVLAKMTGFQTPYYIAKDGKKVYQLNFTAQTAAEANTPYMIKPGHKNGTNPYDVTMIAANEMNEAYRAELTKDHGLSTNTAEDGTEVVMYGWFKKRQMKLWELYFQNPIDTKTNEYNKHCVFKRIINAADAPEIRGFRCYWRIWLEGEARDDASAGSKNAFFRFADDDETTGIEQVDSNISIEIGNIYDLNGRKMDLSKENLPKGLFIINGKKVMINK